MRAGEEGKRGEPPVTTTARAREEEEDDDGEDGPVLGYPLDLGYEDGLTQDMFAAYRRVATTFCEASEPQNTAKHQQQQQQQQSVYNRDWELNELLQFNVRFQQAVEVLNSSSIWETEPNQVCSFSFSLFAV
jgi:hypothetical protein